MSITGVSNNYNTSNYGAYSNQNIWIMVTKFQRKPQR